MRLIINPNQTYFYPGSNSKNPKYINTAARTTIANQQKTSTALLKQCRQQQFSCGQQQQQQNASKTPKIFLFSSP